MVDQRWPNNSEVSRPAGIRWIVVMLLLLPCALAILLMMAEEQYLPDSDACYMGRPLWIKNVANVAWYVQMLDQLSKDIA